MTYNVFGVTLNPTLLLLHSSIKMMPVQASQNKNEIKVYMNLYPDVVGSQNISNINLRSESLRRRRCSRRATLLDGLRISLQFQNFGTQTNQPIS